MKNLYLDDDVFYEDGDIDKLYGMQGEDELDTEEDIEEETELMQGIEEYE